jgi:hypothetical protein
MIKGCEACSFGCGRVRSADAIPPAGLQQGSFSRYPIRYGERPAAVAATTILIDVLDLLKAPRLRARGGSSSLALKSIRLDCKVSSS